jgi:hypothetical protein
MISPFFVRRHPATAEGQISLAVDRELVRLSCKWPADLLTDEWIELSNAFRFGDYAAAVERLRTEKSVTVPAVGTGSLTVSVTAAGVKLEMIDSAGNAPTRLDWEFDADPTELQPR